MVQDIRGAAIREHRLNRVVIRRTKRKNEDLWMLRSVNELHWTALHYIKYALSDVFELYHLHMAKNVSTWVNRLQVQIRA